MIAHTEEMLDWLVIFNAIQLSDSQALEWLYTMNGVHFLFLTQVSYLCTEKKTPTQFELI